MTDIELQYYKVLQGVFKEKMGAWKYRDNCWCSKCGVTMYHNLCSTRYGRELLRLPLPIDTRNPERGLTGMIKDMISIDNNGKHGWSVNIMLDSGKTWQEREFKGDTPTLALLKALAWQEGVKVND